MWTITQFQDKLEMMRDALAQFEAQKEMAQAKDAQMDSSISGSMIHSDGLFDDIEYEKGIDFMFNLDDKTQSDKNLKDNHR